MKRVFRISEIASPSKSELPHRFVLIKSLPNPPPPGNPTRTLSTKNPGYGSSKPVSDLYGQFEDKWVYAEARAKEELVKKVNELRDELMMNVEDEDSFQKVLEIQGSDLFKIYTDGAVLVELLNLLEDNSRLAMKVFNWRRQMENNIHPITSEEYAKGIKIAGRLKDLNLAIEIFFEAIEKRVKNSSIYNALMGAYMINGLPDKCQSVFNMLKQDADCQPTTATYNILISVFGRIMRVHQMETMLDEMRESNIPPDLTTHNNLIAGYITAWMWDKMEECFEAMKTGPIKPNLVTHLLMLRGYAHSRNLEKMEEIYSVVAPYLTGRRVMLIRSMICAYCGEPSRSPDQDIVKWPALSRCPDWNRVKRVEELLRLIPEDDYRPWLHVLLIRLYADEDLIDRMDRSIEEAFGRNTSVNAVNIMRRITASYFRNDAVDRLARFVRQAEEGGWRICRTLYHALLQMYGVQQRIAEMEEVLVEMEKLNISSTRRTLVILYKAYTGCEQEYVKKCDRIVGLMWKRGFGLPL